MLQNKYMDSCIQKAFINSIPVGTEQQWKLASIIQEAQKKHHSLTLSWLDLANADGIVYHQLIRFALNHYNGPTKVMNVV